MRALSVFLAFLFISCASGPTIHNGKYKIHFTVPRGWKALSLKSDLKAFFKEAYTPDIAAAIVKDANDSTTTYILIKSDRYKIDVSGVRLNDAITSYLESAFDKKRRVFDLYDYSYSVYEGAVLKGSPLVATESFRDDCNGVPCDMVSNILFYPCGPGSCFTFVSLVSHSDETKDNLSVLNSVTEDMAGRL